MHFSNNTFNQSTMLENMKIKTAILLILAILELSCGVTDFPDNYQSRDEWNNFLDVVNGLSPKFGEDALNEVAEDEDPSSCRLNYVSEFPFNCPPLESTKAPTSVHELTPADISVVGALGDSITAAFGMEACTLANIGTEFRGRSWSIGGDEDVNSILTVANLLKFYNPNLKGYSVGNGGPNSPAARFNVAVGGARAEHMPGQARELVKRIVGDPEVDDENDWKVVTLFIGGNDLCQYCFNENKYSAEQYVDYIRQALDIMHENLPRTFVNVIGILLIPELGYYSTPKCDLIHIGACNCAMFLEGDKYKQVWDLTRAYQVYMVPTTQRQTEDLIMSGRYDTKDDFTVVYLPYWEDTHLPFLENGEVDGSYFAPDCFHFSSRGHAVGAKEIWNNMLQPVGKKNRTWEPNGNIYCPSQEFPYFYTNINSKKMESASSFTQSSVLILSLCLFVSEIVFKL